jgi:NAD(P)-dependent dehydrogenase (short-subunit alcohol dehydrogenase family)
MIPADSISLAISPTLAVSPVSALPMSALVVGASQGIGQEFVHQLLASNKFTQVFATYRNPAAPLLAIQDERLQCFAMDITEEAQITQVIKKIQAQTPKLHLVINCVGWLHEENLQPEKSLRALNANQLERYFRINSIGAALLLKAAIPLLKHSESSVFATLSAKVGSIGDNQIGGWYGYRASKAALNMLIRTAAIEYKRTCPQAILVALHPGTTDTRLSKPFQRSVPPEKLFSAERTVTQLLRVINQLQPTDSGEFFSWDGSRLPW